jgi:hypothetical protein
MKARIIKRSALDDKERCHFDLLWDEMKQDLAIQIAKLLVNLDENDILAVSTEAKDMAIRAKRGWWETPGMPWFNKGMKKLRKLVEGKI